MIDDPDEGLELAPRIARPLVRQVWSYRRPAALMAVLRACERRWEGTRDAGAGRVVYARQATPQEAASVQTASTPTASHNSGRIR